MAYKDFEEGRTVEVEAYSHNDWLEPPEWALAHKQCVENQIGWKPNDKRRNPS